MIAKRTTNADNIPLVRGSGNVFADLQVSNPEEALVKARIASALADVIRAMGLSKAGGR